MAAIQKLPDALANQIAAGEVVERPASVVKELVENALDAGAQRIAVVVEYGGKRLVRVEDDGTGMGPEDARLCLERHATSKIRSADDLAAIRTLGFRGEALPSIASVSHFRLRTRARGATAGTDIRVNGGIVQSIVDTAAPEGTSVEVADLFYNLPARQKFLKSDAAEAAQVSRLLTQLALCYPEVGISLASAGRQVLQCAPVSTLRDRVYQLYGERADLLEVHRQTGEFQIHGYIAALAAQGPTRGPQHVFVNRRIVKDRTIAHAIIDAYSVASNRERSPEVHLFLTIPHNRLDVNVHPTKAEVRFRDQSAVHELVRRAIGETIGQSSAPEWRLNPASASPPGGSAQGIPGVLAGGVFPSRWLGGPDRSEARATGSARVVLGQNARDEGRQAPPPLIPLGQFRDTFIIAIDSDAVVIIDQHVAHERVLFERTMQSLSEGPLERQRLLVPLVVTLSPAEHASLLSRRGELLHLGFEVEEFGGGSIKVDAVPAIVPHTELDAALRALAQDLEGLDRGLRLEEALKRIAASVACHAAIKANYRLTFEQMTHILDELRATSYSTVCPHGRPVMLRITRREVEKNFERI